MRKYRWFEDAGSLTIKQKEKIKQLCINPLFGEWVENKEKTKLVICEENNEIIGWSAISVMEDWENGEQWEKNTVGVYVEEKYRSQGIGSKLMEILRNKTKGITLIANPRHQYPASRKIFEKLDNTQVY